MGKKKRRVMIVVLSPVIAALWANAVEIVTTNFPSSDEIGVMEVATRVSLPSPNWPQLPFPMANTVPSSVRARKWLPPPATTLTIVRD